MLAELKLCVMQFPTGESLRMQELYPLRIVPSPENHVDGLCRALV